MFCQPNTSHSAIAPLCYFVSAWLFFHVFLLDCCHLVLANLNLFEHKPTAQNGIWIIYMYTCICICVHLMAEPRKKREKKTVRNGEGEKAKTMTQNGYIEKSLSELNLFCWWSFPSQVASRSAKENGIQRQMKIFKVSKQSTVLWLNMQSSGRNVEIWPTLFDRTSEKVNLCEKQRIPPCCYLFVESGFLVHKQITFKVVE